MMIEQVFMVGLRLSPDRPDPDFYTLWFDGDDGKARIASVDGRLQWSQDPGTAWRLTDSEYDLYSAVTEGMELDSVCSIPGLLYSLTHPDDADSRLVSLALNLLDDFVHTTGHRLPNDVQSVLDQIVVRLTEGEPLREAISGRENEAVEAVMASLGRILCFSDFGFTTGERG